jgi:alkyl hydroperoxide reductase subunit AhpC
VEQLAEVSSLPFPLVADLNGAIAKIYGMLDTELPSRDERQPFSRDKLPMTVRNCILIDSKKKIRCLWMYPPQIGRNTHEILRALKAIRKAEAEFIVTPVNWCLPDGCSKVIIPPSVSDAEAAEKYPNVEKTSFSYLRYTDI